MRRFRPSVLKAGEKFVSARNLAQYKGRCLILAIDLVGERSRERDQAFDEVRRRGLDLSGAVDRARVRVRRRGEAFDRACERANVRARAFAADVDRALVFVVETDHARISVQVREIDRLLDRTIFTSSDNRFIRDKIQKIMDALDRVTIRDCSNEVDKSELADDRSSRVAISVARYAVRVVPFMHRCRYDEEFRAELAEIAARGRWWTQVAYSFRVLVRGIALRRALRSMPPEAAEPAQTA